MKRLLVAGMYLVGFWLTYPLAQGLAWAWERWDQMSAARHPTLHRTTTWYAP
jgi:hypothetical protein